MVQQMAMFTRLNPIDCKRHKAMTNGELLEEIRAILNQEKPVPEITERASLRLLLAAMIKMHEKLELTDVKLDKSAEKLAKLDEDLIRRTVLRDKQSEDMRKIAVAVVITVIAVIIDIVLHFVIPGF